MGPPYVIAVFLNELLREADTNELFRTKLATLATQNSDITPPIFHA